MLIVFSHILGGSVHRELDPPHPTQPRDQTVDRDFYYCAVWKRLKRDVWWKRPDLWSAKNWILHDHNAAPCHRFLLLAYEFLTKNNMVTLRHPPYSPDLAPARISVSSPTIKMQIECRRLNTVVEIQRESQKVLDSLTENDSQAGFQNRQEC
ncbi:uncharacterized protein LOC115220390 [Octopus sinensis]|uniref:Uncharacterized protein LOC115220390 n=1 Tax=Octopus sinensis TaxID=2607531 RepID=A0A6P7T9D9_9MOLL|nr:uncharacterized protein LOC115220390 [Octopus sinensis]